MAKGKRGSRKQEEIPGTELPKHAELEEAADLLEDSQLKKRKAGEDEKNKHARVLGIMRDKNIKYYRLNDGRTVELRKGSDKVVIRRRVNKGKKS